jgi:tetratricopeptide (TPR) repeat protein
MASADADVLGRVALLEEGLALARTAGADGESAMLLAYLAAAAAEAGHLERVRTLLDEGQALGRRSGDAWSWVQPLAQLGWLAIADGRLVEAELAFQKALDLAEGIGYVAASAMALVGLGQVALRRSELELARELHCKALFTQRDAGGAYLASGLVYLASVEEAAGAHERAQCLMGASEAWHDARGGAFAVWLPWTHGPLRRGLVRLPPAPTEPLLAQARAEGRAMSLDEAVSYALQARVQLPRQPPASVTG